LGFWWSTQGEKGWPASSTCQPVLSTAFPRLVLVHYCVRALDGSISVTMATSYSNAEVTRAQQANEYQALLDVHRILATRYSEAWLDTKEVPTPVARMLLHAREHIGRRIMAYLSGDEGEQGASA
jgi:hypothetical protein